MSPLLVRLSLDAPHPAYPPLTGAHSQHPGGTQWWGAVWAHLSDPAPWGAAAEVGICPGCFGTLGGM